MGILGTKPLPFCSAAMLMALTDASKGRQISASMCQSLRSRGWATTKGVITQKGIEYLASRKNSHS